MSESTVVTVQVLDELSALMRKSGMSEWEIPPCYLFSLIFSLSSAPKHTYPANHSRRS